MAQDDVRRCPDAAINCDGSPECDESTSGCSGTVHLSRPSAARVSSQRQLLEEGAYFIGCRDGLEGVFCLLCDHQNKSDRTYYSHATRTAHAQCKECRGLVRDTLLIVAGLLLLVAAVALVLWWIHDRLSAALQEQLRDAWHKFALHVKLKILIGFYLIATKVDRCVACEQLGPV